MGRYKQRDLEGQDQKAQALEILVKAGCVKLCEDHFTYEDLLGGDPTEAYKLGNAMITRGDSGVSTFNGNRREMTDAIKEALEECSADGCPQCAKRERD